MLGVWISSCVPGGVLDSADGRLELSDILVHCSNFAEVGAMTSLRQCDHIILFTFGTELGNRVLSCV